MRRTPFGAMMGFGPSTIRESSHVSSVTIDQSGYLQMLCNHLAWDHLMKLFSTSVALREAFSPS